MQNKRVPFLAALLLLVLVVSCAPGGGKLSPIEMTLTPAGEAKFLTMVSVVQDFDRRLRQGLGERELATLRVLLQRLGDNAAASAMSQKGAHT